MNKTITKADIVQRLLNDKHITAEEAVVLLMTQDYRLERKFEPWPNIFPYFNPYEIKASNDPNKK